jgi:hypothetical protein
MRSGDRPGLQNRRAAGLPVAGAFDSHTLPPFINDLAGAPAVPTCRGDVLSDSEVLHVFTVNSGLIAAWNLKMRPILSPVRPPPSA